MFQSFVAISLVSLAWMAVGCVTCLVSYWGGGGVWLWWLCVCLGGGGGLRAWGFWAVGGLFVPPVAPKTCQVCGELHVPVAPSSPFPSPGVRLFVCHGVYVCVHVFLWPNVFGVPGTRWCSGTARVASSAVQPRISC